MGRGAAAGVCCLHEALSYWLEEPPAASACLRSCCSQTAAGAERTGRQPGGKLARRPAVARPPPSGRPTPLAQAAKSKCLCSLSTPAKLPHKLYTTPRNIRERPGRSARGETPEQPRVPPALLCRCSHHQPGPLLTPFYCSFLPLPRFHSAMLASTRVCSSRSGAEKA